MRFAIFHCRHCLQHIWVPETKLGLRGMCPECGTPVQTPADVPAYELIDGPPIMQDFREAEPVMAASLK